MHLNRAVELLAVVALSAGSGWFYSAVFDTRVWPAVLHGLTIGAPILIFERGYILPALRAKLRRASTPIFLVISLVGMGAAVIAGNTLAGILLSAGDGGSIEPIIPDRATLIYSLVAATLLITAFRVRDLIGPKTLISLLIGRYHRPVREARVFLFLDLVGSTRYARQNGDIKALALLGRVYGSLAGPVRRSGGEIDDYVGDMAVVTWSLRRGVRNAAAVCCVYDFLDEIERDARRWQRDFGEVPRFRAALHCGSVLTAEIGVERHKITYFGDVMNTTSRLEGLAKELGVDLVLSTALLDLLQPLPPHIRAEDLGSRHLRGRDEPLAVSALYR